MADGRHIVKRRFGHYSAKYCAIVAKSENYDGQMWNKFEIEIQDGGRPPSCKSLHRHISVTSKNRIR